MGKLLFVLAFIFIGAAEAQLVKDCYIDLSSTNMGPTYSGSSPQLLMSDIKNADETCCWNRSTGDIAITNVPSASGGNPTAGQVPETIIPPSGFRCISGRGATRVWGRSRTGTLSSGVFHCDANAF